MTASNRDRLIFDCLASAAGGVKRTGKGRWEFSMLNGTAVAGLASMEESWLDLTAPIDGPGVRRSDWELLCQNRSLRGLSKFALGSLSRARELRAELPLDAEEGFASGSRHLTDACAGFRSALAWIHGSAACDGEVAAPNHNPEGAIELSRLLDETGWPYTARSPQKCTAELEARFGYYHAVVENQEGCGLLAYTDVATWASLSDAQRQALGAFLLAASAAVRMARATVLEQEHQAVARFEIRLASPDACELGHSLAALSVAANLFGREAQSFEDERIVRAYLTAIRSA